MEVEVDGPLEEGCFRMPNQGGFTQLPCFVPTMCGSVLPGPFLFFTPHAIAKAPRRDRRESLPKPLGRT